MSDAYDLLVRGAEIVLPEGVIRADIAASAGRIVRIGTDLGTSAKELVDARGLHVIAGIIDSHVHFNEPGRSGWEGFETGSAAAAAGGATAFFDMPLNSLPPVTDAASFELKRAAAERASRTDFGIWGGLVPGNVDKLEAMRDAGAVGFKAFMCDSGVEEFPLSDPATLRAGMKRAAALGMLVAVHAEDDALACRRTAEQHALGTDARTWLGSRPVELELAAIRTATEIAGETGCALHIVHVSSPEGVALAREARKRGVDVTVETCPHYLLLTEEDVIRLGAPAKCFPPLRPDAVRLGLWRELESGGIDTVGSDHSPAPPDMKRSEDFFAVWGGISGCQHGFELLLSEALDASTAGGGPAASLETAFGQRRPPIPRRPGEGDAGRGTRRRHDDHRHRRRARGFRTMSSSTGTGRGLMTDASRGSGSCGRSSAAGPSFLRAGLHLAPRPVIL